MDHILNDVLVYIFDSDKDIFIYKNIPVLRRFTKSVLRG